MDPDRIYSDLASGRKDDRPGLNACLKVLQPGNALVVWKLDWLGRDLKHLVTTVDELRTRSIGLKVLAGLLHRLTQPPQTDGHLLEFLRRWRNSSGN